MKTPSEKRPGPLCALAVVELASEHAAWAGKLLADLGADVTLVEPPGGHATRTTGPFVDDRPGPERSLWWWHHHTSKNGVVLDLDTPVGVELLHRLVARCRHRLGGRATGSPGRPRHRPGGHHDRLALLDLGVRVALRSGGATGPGPGQRPHADGRGRSGVELRLRRPCPAAGARPGRAGGPRRRRPCRHGDADRRGAPGFFGDGSAHRCEHARRAERHHRVGVVRMAGGRAHRAAPNRAARLGVPDLPHPGAGDRRPLCHPRLPAARRPRLPGHSRLDGGAGPGLGLS